MSDEVKNQSDATDEPPVDSTVGAEHDKETSKPQPEPGESVAEEVEDSEESVKSQEASAEDNLEVQLATALAKAEEFKDQYMRAKAESENTRRRAQTDVSNARKFAVEEFAREMLNVKDSLDLARSVELNEADPEAVKKMLEGLDLTLRQMEVVFERFSLQTVDPGPGEKFNPELHQAMTTQESADIPANHIVATIQKGFTLHERLLRPAMVIVAKAANDDEKAESG